MLCRKWSRLSPPSKSRSSWRLRIKRCRFQGDSTEGLSVENFKKKIDESWAGYSAFDTSYYSVKINMDLINKTHDELTNIEKAVKDLKKASEQQSSISNYKQYRALAAISAYKSALENLRANYDNVRPTLNGIKDKVLTDLREARSRVERDYESSFLGTAVGNSRHVYQDKCNRYLDVYCNSYKSAAREYVAATQRAVISNEAYINFSKQQFDQDRIISAIKDTVSFLDLRVYNSPFITLGAWSFNNYIPFPVFGESTMNLGPFGLLAKWLIDTNKEMVLITGMLGFGLLGAGISSLIRDRKGVTSKVIVFDNNVRSTLVGGISASLVIFLSAKGGTAIISASEEVELNMYTLLFVCMIGAVFSESVWERAYKYINK